MHDLDLAEQFFSAPGPILAHPPFGGLFRGGGAAPVRAAVAAYRNPDGGFGHGLEPDGRTPGSQPAATEQALRILDPADAWDEELVRGACDQLEATAPAGGGAIFVDPNVEGWPHAPWWQPGEGFSLISTGQIAGPRLAPGRRPGWVDRAAELIWGRIGALGEPGPYDLYGVLRFLDHVSDRERAAAALERVAPAAHAVVTLDPPATGEGPGPLGSAPLPDSIARPLFDEATIAAHLDHLAAGQQADGGWTFNFPAWSPAQEADWRGSVTVDALHTLRRNERPV